MLPGPASASNPSTKNAPKQLNSLQKRDPLARRSVGTPAADLVRTAVEALLAKKGEAISVMDMRKVSGVADYFVICTGGSDVQIKALANETCDRIRDAYGERPWHIEGMDSLQWVLIDYVDVVVHVMMNDAREFYGLERLWGDAPIEHIDTEQNEVEISLLASPGRRAEDEG